LPITIGCKRDYIYRLQYGNEFGPIYIHLKNDKSKATYSINVINNEADLTIESGKSVIKRT